MADVEIAHVVVQIVKSADPLPSELTHAIVQVVSTPPPAESRVFHAIVQIVPLQAPLFDDLSGLYFLNENKALRHDSYYHSTELKIPNPTIKTALLGE